MSPSSTPAAPRLAVRGLRRIYGQLVALAGLDLVALAHGVADDPRHDSAALLAEFDLAGRGDLLPPEPSSGMAQ